VLVALGEDELPALCALETDELTPPPPGVSLLPPLPRDEPFEPHASAAADAATRATRDITRERMAAAPRRGRTTTATRAP